ncbi:type VI secretion system baseplate subunit TssG [Runella sp.]|uniref:type VI secretion system baseplate subunit TssG n=1 Tax=Runella sp. TaxID=1960881 RepID=UPI003D0AEA78
MPTEELKIVLDQLPVRRLRVEAIVDELIESGFCRKEEIVIYPERSSAYFYERDVADIEEVFNELSGTSWYRVNTPRDGLYDTLPERLFHRPTGRNKTDEQWDEIRAEEEQQEDEARQFFLPFDNAITHQRVRIEQFEKQALAGQDKGFLKEFLAIFWPESADLALTDNQEASLFQITTIAHKAAGNLVWMQDCFEQMLGEPVELTYESLFQWLPVETSFMPLGEASLGVDTVIATPSLGDQPLCLKVTIGPLDAFKMKEYVPNGKSREIVDFLASLLIPIELDWRLELLTPRSTEGFQLNPQGQGALLGFTTVL